MKDWLHHTHQVQGKPGSPTPCSAVTHLSVFVQDVAEEPVGVREALGSRALPHAHHPVLLRMKHSALGKGTGTLRQL